MPAAIAGRLARGLWGSEVVACAPATTGCSGMGIGTGAGPALATGVAIAICA